MSVNKHKSPALLSGVLLLTVANMAVKIIGLLFKIPLSHLLGDEGMGYFNSAYTIYSWLYMIATAGLPVAVSILISNAAERGAHRRVDRVFRVAMILFLIIGSVGFLLMFSLASPLARLIGNEESRYAIAAVAPTLFFICIVGCIRGYFQGHKKMLPTAVSQIMEAAGKLFLGILFGTLAARAGKSVPVIAAYAILGVTVGTAAGAFYLLLCGLIDKRRRKRAEPSLPDAEDGGILSSMLRIALPITVSSAVMSLTNLIDLGFIMNRLRNAGYSESMASSIFGNYTTLAVPMFHLPAVLIFPIASSLVPYLSADLAVDNLRGVRSLVTTALRFASLLSIPCAVGLALFSGRILSLFFPSDSAAMAAPVLSTLAPGIIFSGITTVTNAILQAYGKANLTVRSMCVGAGVKILFSYALIGNPAFGIYGAAIGTVGCYAVAAVMNLHAIARLFAGLPSFSLLFTKPMASVALSLVPSLFLGRWMLDIMPQSVLSLFLIASVAFFYVAFLILFGAVKKEDLDRFPQGQHLLRRIERGKK